MSRYIKVDALEKHKFVSWTVPEFFDEKSLEQQAYQLGWNNAIEAIMENEPAADVVEVVRCEDCKYIHTTMCPFGLKRTPRNKDFCFYGKRREDAT